MQIYRDPLVVFEELEIEPFKKVLLAQYVIDGRMHLYDENGIGDIIDKESENDDDLWDDDEEVLV